MRVLFVIFALLAAIEVNNVSAQDGQIETQSSSEQQTRLVEWMQTIHNSIQRRLLIEEELIGQEVKYQVSIDVFGNVVDVRLLKSSGNSDLEKYAKLAILQAQPFDLSKLNESDFDRAQVFNVVIAPK
ncbi:energy transducer TonB [Vibrio sinaloensis]|uniref:energy transducer TonB n=1 Tax=Photobacterium sp. (strain ATCC 43367) TaxID=379097 RepID=UPI0022B07985|nr:TonB C-terminal domain-containing protein [Vibrio sinaloensis]MCZ4293547.1 TonB C-terminal domain-containing protein [Vibrio sinaloensis]